MNQRSEREEWSCMLRLSPTTRLLNGSWGWSTSRGAAWVYYSRGYQQSKLVCTYSSTQGRTREYSYTCGRRTWCTGIGNVRTARLSFSARGPSSQHIVRHDCRGDSGRGPSGCVGVCCPAFARSSSVVAALGPSSHPVCTRAGHTHTPSCHTTQPFTVG